MLGNAFPICALIMDSTSVFIMSYSLFNELLFLYKLMIIIITVIIVATLIISCIGTFYYKRNLDEHESQNTVGKEFHLQ